MGANVLIPEYVGYGLSTGDACEAGCYATADAAYQHLLSRSDIDPRRIVVAGASLEGTVIATQKTANHRYYGRPLTAADILSGSVSPPPRASVLERALSR